MMFNSVRRLIWTSSGGNDVNTHWNTFSNTIIISLGNKEDTGDSCILHSKVKFYVNRNKNFSLTLYYNVIPSIWRQTKSHLDKLFLPTDVSFIIKTHSWSWFRSTNKTGKTSLSNCYVKLHMKASYKEKSSVLFVLHRGSTKLYRWTSPSEETVYAVN